MVVATGEGTFEMRSASSLLLLMRGIESFGGSLLLPQDVDDVWITELSIDGSSLLFSEKVPMIMLCTREEDEDTARLNPYTMKPGSTMQIRTVNNRGSKLWVSLGMRFLVT